MSLSVMLAKRINGFFLDIAWETNNDITVLFGHSGAGKSMTLQLIAGIMESDEGSIIANNRILYHSALRINLPPQKRFLGYVSQTGALFPHMTVRENIAYGLKGAKKREKNEKVNRLTDIFRLNGLENHLPSEISGGQKQKVALARALMGNPELLLLDEPFSALDNSIRIEMRRLLKKVNDEFGIPIILVTHDIVEAYSMADKVIVYANGRIVRTGTPDEIFNQSLNPKVEVPMVSEEYFTSQFYLNGLFPIATSV